MPLALLTCFAVWTGEARRAVADAGHVVTGRFVKTLTDLRAIDAVVGRRTRVLAQRSYPAGPTAALSSHQVAVGVVLALARVFAVVAELAFVAFCQHQPTHTL